LYTNPFSDNFSSDVVDYSHIGQLQVGHQVGNCSQTKDSLDLTATISMVSLPYLAGFFDGEGCIHLAKQVSRDPARRPTFRMRVVIGQNNLEILEFFSHEIGVPGKIHKVTRTQKQNRQCYSLIYDGSASFEVLRKLLPFLRRKKHEALVALEYERSCFVNTHPGARGTDPVIWALRAQFYRKLRAMK
jgi:hypothetical protein